MYVSPPALDLPASIRQSARCASTPALSLTVNAFALGKLGDRREELAERRGRNAQPPGLRRAQKRFVEDLARVLHRAALEAVVERADDDRLPEVADRALGLPGALEPRGEALGVVLPDSRAGSGRDQRRSLPCRAG